MDFRLLFEWGIGAVIAMRIMHVFLRSRGPVRLSHPAGRDDVERRLAELEDTQREIGAGETAELKRRIAELEERVDFAERVLARQRDAERVGTPRG